MATRTFLTFASLLPYILGLLLSFTAYKLAAWPFLVVVLGTYSSLIISFISGSHWGIVLNKNESKIRFFNVSLTLLAWLGILFPSWVISWAILLFCFWLLLAMDYHLCRKNYLDKTYLKLRTTVTVLITVMLISLVYMGKDFL